MADDEYTPLERDAWGGLVVTQGSLRRALDAALQERHGPVNCPSSMGGEPPRTSVRGSGSLDRMA